MFFIELISGLLLFCIVCFIVFQVVIPFFQGTRLWPIFQNKQELDNAIKAREQQASSEILNKVKSNDSK